MLDERRMGNMTKGARPIRDPPRHHWRQIHDCRQNDLVVVLCIHRLHLSLFNRMFG